MTIKKNKAEKVIERIIKNKEYSFWCNYLCYGGVEMTLLNHFYGDAGSTKNLPPEYRTALNKIFKSDFGEVH